MIERIFDGEKLNRVVNDPSVYPWVRGACEGPLDLGPVLKDHRHVCLMDEHGGCLFTQHSPGLYEVHSQWLPQGRGANAVTTAQEAGHWMFTRTDALEIFTRCPKGNLAARALARAIGGREEMVLKQGWIQDGKIIPATIFSLTIQQWIKIAPGLVDVGRWFHKNLEEELKLIDFQEPFHEDDESHNRAVGACVEMIRGGQPHKGAVFYNRSASMEGKHPIRILGLDPVVIDIGQQICLEVHGQNFFAINHDVSSTVH
jgi:hypothetical protein